MAAIVPKPLYTVTLEGESFNVEFDTNINETKRGIKIHFIPQNQNIDIRQLAGMANKIATVLQGRFAQYGIQFDRDTQVENPLIIGFMIPLGSISDFIMKNIAKAK
jgi:hypothetical protein